jgi:tripartite-type tricarboxylate transporter receptor subunit TctC
MIVLRAWLLAICLTVACLSGAGAADYPSSPIRLVVPYPPGGPNDLIARIIGQKLTELMGAPVIVVNRPGASTMIGASEVAKAPADGYTLLLGNTVLATSTLLYKHVTYSLEDFVPIAPIVKNSNILAINSSVPATSVAELVAYARANPGKLNYGSNGPGGATNLISAYFNRLAGIDVVAIDYKGVAPATTDLLGGALQIFFYPVTGSFHFFTSGQLRALAVTSEQRLPQLPDVPTLKESGYPTMVTDIWYGILGPAALSPPIVAKLNQAINQATESADVRARLAGEGGTVMTMSPTEFSRFMTDNMALWADIIRPLNLQLD